MNRREYEEAILRVFAEAYPNSAQYRGGRKLRKGNWQRKFPAIEESVDHKNAFLAAVENLSREGLLSVQWQKYRKGDSVKALYLEDSEGLYRRLGIPSPQQAAVNIRDFLSKYTPHSLQDGQAARGLLDIMEAGTSLPVTEQSLLEDILTLFALDREEAGRYALRALSTRLYNDSKRLENILRPADEISGMVLGYSITRELGLARRYPETTLAGNIILEFTDGRRWDLAGHAVTMPLATARQVGRVLNGSGYVLHHVLSVENKETFHVLSDGLKGFDGLLYTGGHPNEADRVILATLSGQGTLVHHAGDLDPVGLQIFEEIDEICGGTLLPFRMNRMVYMKYAEYGYRLKGSELMRLDFIKNIKVAELAETIRENGVGVEQEIIDYFQLDE
ncbi:MAG: DUF2399 domain-containing protein [Spirochaetota bacterium]